MRPKPLFLFLAALCAVTLVACGKPETPSANSVTSVTIPNNVVPRQTTELPAASATTVSARTDVKELSIEEGLALAQKNHCLECHSIEKKVIGPAWMDVSKRYKGVAGSEDRLVVKVSTGGYGNWGNMPMPALAPDVKEKDIRVLVKFILGLAK